MFGVTFIGLTPSNGTKLIFTVVLIAVVIFGSRLLRWALLAIAPKKVAFWTRQGVNMLGALVTIIGILSIWFDDPKRLTTAIGLITAGVAFALQRVVTAVSGYFVILRGDTFNVGDRIVMGGVRGDVVALSFMQTTIMEMGESPEEQGDKPSMWVHSRQYTGRLVTVSNAKIFDDPVYNYSRQLPYIWEEMRIPVRFTDDADLVEQILIEVATRHTADIVEMGEAAVRDLEARYGLRVSEAKPQVFWRITSNWVELSVRFLARDHGVRRRKDAMSREILKRFAKEGIQIASGTYAVVEMPILKVQTEAAASKPEAKG